MRRLAITFYWALASAVLLLLQAPSVAAQVESVRVTVDGMT